MQFLRTVFVNFSLSFVISPNTRSREVHIAERFLLLEVIVSGCCCCCCCCCFLFCFVLFCFVLFCFVLFFVLFCFVLFCFVLFCFVLFCFPRKVLTPKNIYHYPEISSLRRVNVPRNVPKLLYSYFFSERELYG